MADDHAIFREGLRKLLDSDDEITIVGEASNGNDCIKMLTKPQTRENFRLRAFSGDAIMTAFAGAVTAVPTVNTSPKEFAPTMQGGLQWSRWGMFVESKERMGEKCDMEVACKLLDYVKEWEHGTNEAERRASAQSAVQTLASVAPEQAIYVADQLGVGRDDGYLERMVQLWAEGNLNEAERWLAGQPDDARTAPLRARIEQVRERNGAPRS